MFLMHRTLLLYHVRLKSTYLGRVKAPQIDDHKSSCIVELYSAIYDRRFEVAFTQAKMCTFQPNAV